MTNSNTQIGEIGKEGMSRRDFLSEALKWGAGATALALGGCKDEVDPKKPEVVVTPVDPYASNKIMDISKPGDGISSATIVRYTANGDVVAFVDKATFDLNTLSPKAFATFLAGYNEKRISNPDLPVITSIDELKQYLNSGVLELYKSHSIGTSQGGVSYVFRDLEKISFEQIQKFKLPYGESFINAVDDKEYPSFNDIFALKTKVDGEERYVIRKGVGGGLSIVVMKPIGVNAFLPVGNLVEMEHYQDPNQFTTTPNGN